MLVRKHVVIVQRIVPSGLKVGEKNLVVDASFTLRRQKESIDVPVDILAGVFSESSTPWLFSLDAT